MIGDKKLIVDELQGIGFVYNKVISNFHRFLLQALYIYIMSIDYSYLAPPLGAHSVQHTDYYIKHHEREKGARKIYDCVPYDTFEQEKIRELKQEIQKLNIQLPSDWKESDYLKIGYSGRFKMKEVIKKLQLHLSWRANPIYHQINPATEKFLKDGICYIFGRDKQYRPIVILNAHMIDLKKYDKETIIQALSFQMGIIKKHMFIPGKVENWIFLLESNGLGVFGLPTKALQVVIDTMSTNFGGCLEKMFILNPSSGLNFLWKTISGFLDPETAEKINFFQKKDFMKLQQIIDPNQLEQKYGGTQPNQITFWPPYNLDLVDGRTVPKQKQQIDQFIPLRNEENQIQKNEDPYDNVENNVNDFFETQKQLYNFEQKKSAEFGQVSQVDQKDQEQPQKQELNDQDQQKVNDQIHQQSPEKENQQQQEIDQNNNEQNVQQTEHENKREADSQEQLHQQQEGNISKQEPEQEVQKSGEQQQQQNHQEQTQKVEIDGNNNKNQQEEENQVVSNASATKIIQPEEVQGQNVEMTQVDPVANQACCKGCEIF
ncbi:unnamed protein product [Paramecium octaurelia]|uniref:CRAL-TRIO domain-containing protein n=1 Tax=Paramecium octaurelia TaxID=43137 RepID=A0A8S1W8I4_PAROT|nr:unnamed protein product [Paramecium octaurelia]